MLINRHTAPHGHTEQSKSHPSTPRVCGSAVWSIGQNANEAAVEEDWIIGKQRGAQQGQGQHNPPPPAQVRPITPHVVLERVKQEGPHMHKTCYQIALTSHIPTYSIHALPTSQADDPSPPAPVPQLKIQDDTPVIHYLLSTTITHLAKTQPTQDLHKFAGK